MMRFAYTIALYLLLVAPLAAQITFTTENYHRPDAWVDTAYSASTSLVALPDTGANQVWDFSSLPLDSICCTDSIFAGTNPAFPLATTFNRNIATFAGIFPVPVQNWAGATEGGYGEFGYTSGDVTYPVTTITGGADDKIRFVGGNTVATNGGAEFVVFPTTFGTMIRADYSESINFELTVAAFGLNATPGALKTDFSLERDFVGYGTLILPSVGGGDPTSYSALMRRTITTITDSLFLGGAPAPPQIVAAFGQVQGNVRMDTSFAFLGLTDITAVLLSYGVNDTSYTFRPTRTPLNTTSVSNPLLVRSKAYPNPVAAGQALSFEFPTGLQVGSSVRIVALDGRTVYQRQLSEAISKRVTVELPASLTPSLYVYTFHDRSGRLLASGKIRTE